MPRYDPRSWSFVSLCTIITLLQYRTIWYAATKLHLIRYTTGPYFSTNAAYYYLGMVYFSLTCSFSSVDDYELSQLERYGKLYRFPFFVGWQHVFRYTFRCFFLNEMKHFSSHLDVMSVFTSQNIQGLHYYNESKKFVIFDTFNTGRKSGN